MLEGARQEFTNRAARSQFVNSDMFGEAGWDMLPALYVAEQSAARHTVSGLLSLSRVRHTTALRWLQYLQREELVTRQANPPTSASATSPSLPKGVMRSMPISQRHWRPGISRLSWAQ